MESTMQKKESIQLAVGQMITITRGMQTSYMSQEQTSYMKGSPLKNCSTTRNAQIQIHSLQKLVEKTLVSTVLSPEPNAHRSTTKLQYRSTIVQNHHPLDPEGYARAMDGYALQVSREDIADIRQMANGAENLFVQQHNTPEHQRTVTNESYNTAGGVDDRFKPKYRQRTRPSIDIDVPTSIDRRPEFGKRAYEHDGVRRSTGNRRMISEIFWKEPQWMSTTTYVFQNMKDHSHRLSRYQKSTPKMRSMRCFMESVDLRERMKFQMKIDGVYYPLNDILSWLTTCLEEMRQDIARMQTQRAVEATTLPSIDRNILTSIDDDPSPSIPTKSIPDSYTRAELDQIVQDIYGTLGESEDRLDKRCDDIYLPWNNTISSLTSQTEAMQREIDEI
ncbi:hypothetical protein F2Q68_00031013 [Brassica cretica]|uniref:Uncharacterized protein n=1 Tax=Brassica cretica TaxID=69181 RepID=A0A8S9G274_BRACR|nr:hypothetical protein F2Q68_00031013 [Brassica cretica]